MADLLLSNVHKSFGSVGVIHDVSLDVAHGEFVSFVGPSGSGKSTLLRMIAGLENLSGGDLSIAGQIVNDLPPNKRGVAMVFQNYALYPHKTVEQNMGYALKLARVPKADIRKKVVEAAEILDLVPLLGRYPRQLSGGQRQRVAMGRAIVRDPDLFLFDEPLSNLDAKLRVQMRAEIKGLHQRLSTTIIYVTHDQVEAMTMSDRIVVLNHGRIEQVGSPLELYDHPKNIFVAGFLGSPSMNLIEGTIRAEAGGIAFHGNRGGIIPLAETPPSAAMGKPVTLGIRPEKLMLANGDDVLGFDATTELVEPTGSETIVSAGIGQDHLTVLISDRIEIPPGQSLRLASRSEHLHFFDTENGQAIT